MIYFLLQSLNGGLVMVSFDSADLSCGGKASLFDVIGKKAIYTFSDNIKGIQYFVS